MIRITQLSKRFRRLQVLQDISCQFEKGQVISLLGPNGSGKTTLIKSILGMVRPDKGSIEVNGRLIGKDPSYRSAMGYMPQIGRFPDNMRVKQLFDLVRELRNAREESLDLDLVRDLKLPDLYDKKMRTLSGGMRQKVSAALAFLFNPDCLILDEPTAGLDPLAAEIFKEKVRQQREQGKLVLITSHVLSDLEELTTHVLYLTEGRMCFFESLNDLLARTGENKLSRAIAQQMIETPKQGPSTII